MKRVLFVVVFMTVVAGLAPAAPVKVIFDTDMAEDVDDAGALALLHALADRGEVEILGCMISAPNPFTGPCIDAINTWYGRPDIPIGNLRDFQRGYPRGADNPIASKYTEAVARGFPRDLPGSMEAPDAVTLYRKILGREPDHSVVIITVGFLTNLRNLLDSSPDLYSEWKGEELVRRKVKEWVCMGGKFPEGTFPDGGGEYNVTIDTVASVRAINDWPGPVIFSGFEIGNRIFTGANLKLTASNPVRAAYEHYNGLKDRESWDHTAVLYAVRGTMDYWTLSDPGQCLMHARVPHGYNEWLPTAAGRHRYLLEEMAPGALASLIEGIIVDSLKDRKDPGPVETPTAAPAPGLR
jgi:inosine-uridine nucleoside N-ribohydrolase